MNRRTMLCLPLLWFATACATGGPGATAPLPGSTPAAACACCPECTDPACCGPGCCAGAAPDRSTGIPGQDTSCCGNVAGCCTPAAGAGPR